MTNTFKGIIDLWPSPDAMAVDVGAKVEAVRKWRQRDIPAEYWAAVVRAAADRDLPVTLEKLAHAASSPPHAKAS